jgi:hypothetical protein
MQIERKRLLPGANVVTQKWSLWQQAGKRRSGAVEIVLLWRGLWTWSQEAQVSVGSWVSDQGFCSTANLVPSDIS